jgi:uncharacterized membrane protein
MLFTFINGVYTEETGTQLPLTAYLLAATSMAVGAAIVILFESRLRMRQELSVLKALPSDEQKVMEVLVRERRIEQAYIGAETGLSRLKVSRALDRLERRGVVKRKHLGNTNLVSLEL